MSTESSSNQTPLILFSGMGAGPSVFGPQKRAFPHLVVPDWQTPVEGDDLASYGARLAATIDPGCGCFVGGASFGGIIALEVARHLDAKACFLIGSVRGPHQLPLRIRMMRSLGFGIGLLPITMVQCSAASSAWSAHEAMDPHVAGALQEFSASDVALLRWSARQILQWRSQYDNSVPTFHIHGDHDHVFPICHTTPNEVVPGGGHVISLTHGEQVNAFLRKYMEI